MIHNLIALLIFLLGGVGGFGAYHHRKRIAVAASVLAGRVNVEAGRAVCAREHLQGDEKAIAKNKLQELLDANTQLIAARGFIGGAGGSKANAAFAESIDAIFNKDAAAPKISTGQASE